MDILLVVLAVVLALAVGFITWKYFAYFYVSRYKKYRHSPFELTRMRVVQTVSNMIVVLIFAAIIIIALLNEEMI